MHAQNIRNDLLNFCVMHNVDKADSIATLRPGQNSELF